MNRMCKRKKDEVPNVHVIFIDIKKAYDKINRCLLIAKLLSQTDIPMEIIVWIAKLLSISKIGLE